MLNSLGNGCDEWVFSTLQGMTPAQSGPYDDNLKNISVCHPSLSGMLAQSRMSVQLQMKLPVIFVNCRQLVTWPGPGPRATMIPSIAHQAGVSPYADDMTDLLTGQVGMPAWVLQIDAWTCNMPVTASQDCHSCRLIIFRDTYAWAGPPASPGMCYNHQLKHPD